ncbi:MAG TPA: alpha-glucan family phosphorylase [Steroidobacteraceae bacterium]|jgi:starch phosphorylase|nr:alpha-glucan family phosphorylase [Steroidobacteraceae bacterium]
MRNSLLEVTPTIPGSLNRLPELAANLFFSWHRPIRALFEDLDPELWKQTNGNPRLTLRCLNQKSLERHADDEEYLARYTKALQTLDGYLRLAAGEGTLVAYFCAEYGFHESFPIYSGGLGVLAGDYCKAASDERANFVAVGLLYEQGYFTQTVDNDGLQHAEYLEHDPRDLPVEPVRTPSGDWVKVSVRVAARDVVARLWKAQVGRVPVYLLDTNCAENAPSDRDITHRLYGGDESTRVRQEMILGIGGVRALRAVGLQPAVWHLNEGHAAFLILELLREQLTQSLPFNAALEAVAAQCVFTTHTPVAAGHDAFGLELIVQHLEGFIRELGIPVERLLELARTPSAPGLFNMTRLALNGTRHVNGVSRIHGAVSARLCADQWPEVRPEDNPVGFVTNGVHVPTFLHQRWMEFFDRELGGEWRDRLRDSQFWHALERVPDERYWSTAQDVKSRMLANVRERLQREYERKGGSPAQLRHVMRLLDPQRPDVLTLGFARRFATYKRATLLLRDRARLARLINNPERPVVLLFAGKAHPADEPGKQVLRELRQLMMSQEFVGRVIFVEDYDLQLARSLVSGVDVWLNNPIAPLEASGTSGIKAAINGRLNLSILDGWWAEGWAHDNGWGIPPANVQDPERRDALEAELILGTLAEEVLPLYYDRDDSGCPRDWVKLSKRAMMTVIPRFNMGRVLYDYTRGLYVPAGAHYRRLAADGFTGARTLADWKQRVRAAWPKVSLKLLSDTARDLPRGERLRLRVAAALNGLAPADVRVEFAARRLLPGADLSPPPLSSYAQTPREGWWQAPFSATDEQDNDAAVIFALDVEPPECGQFRTEVRIYPWHELLSHPYELGLMKWL